MERVIKTDDGQNKAVIRISEGHSHTAWHMLDHDNGAVRGAGHSRTAAGYMSVEASFIMTMLLVLWVLMIYLAFYLYDRCLLTQDAYLLCFRESYVKRGADTAAELKALEKRQQGEKYFFLSDFSSAASCSGGKLAYQGTAAVRPSVFGGSGLMQGGRWSLSFHAESRHTDPPYGIRRYRRLRYLAGKLLSELEKARQEEK